MVTPEPPIWPQIERRLNARFGKGQWHCDDLIDNRSMPACVHAFLVAARAPGHGRPGVPRLFATYEGKRVRVVMASRFGDVGITEDLAAETGYTKRLHLPELADFSETP
jgi:hypothetical protein